jgi:ABC-type multidrug transport system permease subunit
VFRRIYAIFKARNLEFLRDRATLAWNIVLPLALMAGLSLAFGAGDRNEFTIGVLTEASVIDASEHPFLETRYIEFVPIANIDEGFLKVGRHQLDLLLRFDGSPTYWINPESAKGYFAERALLQADAQAGGRFSKAEIDGEALRYVDWVLPGILGMNMMFSCLFGVGYVVVRYRKNGFLKRLQATPLRPLEFIIAQIASRMTLVLTITAVVYAGTHIILDTPMEGRYVDLFVVATLGTITLVALGLMIAARVTSEELAGGLLNMINWPMMLLSGVWFSLEAAGPLVQQAAKIFPLTHILDAARAIMFDGASLADVGSNLVALVLMAAVFLTLGARVFRWNQY